VLGDLTCEVPISYGQRYAAAGGNLIYVLDQTAAAGLLARRPELEAKGFEIVDLRGAP
jgi:glucosamine-6-phosphate deaminase